MSSPMTPYELIKMGQDNPIKAENLLLDHVLWMEEKKYVPGYITVMMIAIKPWFDYNRIEIRRKIKVTNSNVPISIQNEIIPDREQLKKILDSSDPRRKTIIIVMSFAGLRPQVMGLADQSDGLVLSDFPDLVLDGNDTHFENIPVMVVVRSNLSKIRKKYFTFLTKGGCEYLLG